MFSFDGYKAIDLSPRVSPRINRFDGSIEEGATDPYGKHWGDVGRTFPDG